MSRSVCPSSTPPGIVTDSMLDLPIVPAPRQLPQRSRTVEPSPRQLGHVAHRLADGVGDALDASEVAMAVGFLAGEPRQGRVGVGHATIYGIETTPAEDVASSSETSTKLALISSQPSSRAAKKTWFPASTSPVLAFTSLVFYRDAVHGRRGKEQPRSRSCFVRDRASLTGTDEA